MRELWREWHNSSHAHKVIWSRSTLAASSLLAHLSFCCPVSGFLTSEKSLSLISSARTAIMRTTQWIQPLRSRTRVAGMCCRSTVLRSAQFFSHLSPHIAQCLTPLFLFLCSFHPMNQHLNRQVIRSNYCSIIMPEIEFEAPPGWLTVPAAAHTSLFPLFHISLLLFFTSSSLPSSIFVLHLLLHHLYRPLSLPLCHTHSCLSFTPPLASFSRPVPASLSHPLLVSLSHFLLYLFHTSFLSLFHISSCLSFTPSCLFFCLSFTPSCLPFASLSPLFCTYFCLFFAPFQICVCSVSLTPGIAFRIPLSFFRTSSCPFPRCLCLSLLCGVH